MSTRRLILATACVLVSSCAHTTLRTDGPTDTNARDLAYNAIGCWLGPVWDGALGVPEADQYTKSTARCRDVVAQTWGTRDPRGDYERLRALEDNDIAELVARIDTLAKRDLANGEREELLVLVRTTAAAQKENLRARRAADKVKLDLPDLGGDYAARVRPATRAALVELRRTRSIEALLRMQLTTLTPDARALGVLSLMDRLEDGLRLPRHLQISAAEPAFRALFDVAQPALPSDPTAEVAPRVWLDYLARAAAAAGHPVPSRTQGEERDRMAWAGVLDGLADKLNAAGGVSDRMYTVVAGAERRLRAEAIGAKNWYASRHPAQQ